MVSTSSTPTPTTKVTSVFYLLDRDDAPSPSDATSSDGLLAKHGLEETYQKFCGKKIKASLSGFLPHLPGVIDEGGQPENTLRSVIDKPPVGGKEILPLQGHALSGFRLNPGPIPDQYRYMNPQPSKKKHKHKKQHKGQDAERPKEGAQTNSAAPGPSEVKPEGGHEKKHKKQKKHDDGERKKKKKDKKKKKRHTPDLVPSGEALQPS